MYSATLAKSSQALSIPNDNYCIAPSPVSSPMPAVASSGFGESGGCVFKVGNDMYFVPTQKVAGDDTIYITCDAQKIEGPLDDWRSRLSLGDRAEDEVEDAILAHLTATARRNQQSEAFVVTRDGKTFRL